MIQIPTTKKDLLQFLKIRHPYFLDHVDDWKFFDEVRRKEISTKRLVKGVTESDGEFKQRTELAVFTPETPMVVERVVGFLKRNDSERDVKNDSGLLSFIDHADKSGREFGDIMIEALTESLWFGAAFVLIDRRSAPVSPTGEKIIPTDVKTSEDVLGRPYAVIYMPTHMVNWVIGDDSQADWAILREEYTVQDEPFLPREERVKYRIFDRQDWVVIELSPVKTGNESKNEIVRLNENDPDQINIEIKTGTHAVGMVPIVPIVPFRDDVGVYTGESFVSTAVRHDLAAWRQESDYRYNLWLHNHPRLVIKGSADAIQDFSSSTAVHLNPDAKNPEEAYYISPPGEIFTHSREAIANDRTGVWIQTYQDAASRITESRSSDQSGVHKRLSFEMAEGAILSHLTSTIVEVEAAILEIVARFLSTKSTFSSGEAVFTGTVSRNKSYDSFWINDYIDTVSASMPIIQHSPTLIENVIRRISRALLDSSNPAQIEKILEEINRNKSLLSNRIDTLIARFDLLKTSDAQSPEILKQILREIAQELVDPETENATAILSEIEREIDEADFSDTESINDEFSMRSMDDASPNGDEKTNLINPDVASKTKTIA